MGGMGDGDARRYVEYVPAGEGGRPEIVDVDALSQEEFIREFASRVKELDESRDRLDDRYKEFVPDEDMLYDENIHDLVMEADEAWCRVRECMRRVFGPDFWR